MERLNKHFPAGLIIVLTLILAAGVAAVLLLVSAGKKTLELPASQTYGIVAMDIDDSSAQTSFHVPQKGVYVLSVDEGSQAARAGVLSGDRIVSINDTEVNTASEFVQQCGTYGEKDRVTLVLERSSTQEMITAELVQPGE